AAMILHRLGQSERARQQLEKSDRQYAKMLDETLASDSLKFSLYTWRHWVIVQILQREAHALLDGLPLAVSPREHLLLARAYIRLGQAERSDAEFQAAENASGNDIQAQLALVHALDHLGRHEQADAAFQRITTHAADDPAPWFDRAWYKI